MEFEPISVVSLAKAVKLIGILHEELVVAVESFNGVLSSSMNPLEVQSFCPRRDRIASTLNASLSNSFFLNNKHQSNKWHQQEGKEPTT